MNRRLRSGVLLAVCALAVAACGDGSDSGTTNGSDTTAATVTTTQPGTGGTPGMPSAACLGATQAMAAAVSAFTQGFTGQPGGNDDVAGQLQAMADAAPEAIQDDLEVLAREIGGFYQAIADLGLTAGATPTPEQIQQLNEASEDIDQDAVDEATENLDAWFEENCEQ